MGSSCLAQDKKPNAAVARMEQIIQASVPKQFMGTVLAAQDGKIQYKREPHIH